MSEQAIHAALVEIEKNLKDLQSARKQVDNVVSSSENLLEELSNATESVMKIQTILDESSGNFGNEFKALLNGFKQDLETHKNQLNDSVSVSIKSAEAIETKFQSVLDEVRKNASSLNEGLKRTKEDIENLNIEDSFKVILNESLNKMNATQNSFQIEMKSSLDEFTSKVKRNQGIQIVLLLLTIMSVVVSAAGIIYIIKR